MSGGKPYYEITFSFARFNAKHVVQASDLSDAKRIAEDTEKRGIWVVEGSKKRTFWGPSAIAKITLELVEPKDG
jgi:hypothetical protein